MEEDQEEEEEEQKIEEKENNKIQIFVKTLDEKVFCLDVESSNKIEEIKKKIQDEEGYPQQKQRIIFENKELKDNKTLNYYKIRDKKVIYLVLRKIDVPINNIKNEMTTSFDEEEKKEQKIKDNEKLKKEENKKNEYKEKKDEINEIIINNEKDNNQNCFDDIYNTKKKKLNNSTSDISIKQPDKSGIEFTNKINEINKEEEKNILSKILPKEINKMIIESKKNNSFDKEMDKFRKKYLKRDELNVNLIHFDLNMINKENYITFNKFKVDVVGGFYAIDDLKILDHYLKKIKDKNIPFIVISSGTSGNDVI